MHVHTSAKSGRLTKINHWFIDQTMCWLPGPTTKAKGRLVCSNIGLCMLVMVTSSFLLKENEEIKEVWLLAAAELLPAGGWRSTTS